MWNTTKKTILSLSRTYKLFSYTNELPSYLLHLNPIFIWCEDVRTFEPTTNTTQKKEVDKYPFYGCVHRCAPMIFPY